MKKFSFVILIICSLAIIVSCEASYTNRKYSCPLKTLLVDDSPFQYANLSYPNDLPPENEAVDSPTVSRLYSLNGTSTYQFVTVFSTEEQAHEAYKKYTGTLFPENDNEGGWEKPEPDFKTISANEMKYECGHRYYIQSCDFSARYKEYQVYLTVEIGDNGFTKQDFISAIKDLDKKMESCLVFESNENK